MENRIELLSLKCASCGAGLSNFQNKNDVKCDFCNSVTRILYPVKVLSSSNATVAETAKFDNLISIMEKSMVAGNYKEAYDYCNKALEIAPDSATLWENKAICCFWNKSMFEHISNQAAEIVAYLNTSKSIDPNSTTYDNTSSSIANNLFYGSLFLYKATKTYYNQDTLSKVLDMANNTKIKPLSLNISGEEINIPPNYIVKIMRLFEICYNINPQTEYLKFAVSELSTKRWIKPNTPMDVQKKTQAKAKAIREGRGPFKFNTYSEIQQIKKNYSTAKIINTEFSLNNNFDAISTRNNYIQQIKTIEPNYQPLTLEIQKKPCFIATATMGDYDHPIVMELRLFRDTWLLNRSWGKLFIKFYYRFGNFPAILISKNRFLKKISYLFIVSPIHKISRFLLKR